MPRRPGPSLTRHDLSAEAIRLGRLLVELLPEPEALGLLALMLLHDRGGRHASRRTASSCCSTIRIDRCGTSVQIAEGAGWWSGRWRRSGSARTRFRRRLPPCMPRRRPRRRPTGTRSSGSTTCWRADDPSPVDRAESRRGGGDARRPGRRPGADRRHPGREASCADYRLAHAARADLCRRLGQDADARASYERALALTRQEPERRFLERRLADLDA